MQNELVLEYGLGRGENRPLLQKGWSAAENGFTWAIGDFSEIVVGLPDLAGSDAALELWLSPHVSGETLPSQRLTVTVNGVPLGSCVLRGRSVVAFRIPGDLARDAMRVGLWHPDARRPCDVSESPDQRALAFAVSRLRVFRVWSASQTGPIDPPASASEADLLTCFESVGDNCEFGLVQRALGAEPLGLLRFSGHPLDLLVRALDERFEKLAERENIEVVLSTNQEEWAIHCLAYGMLYHTFQTKSQISRDALAVKHVARTKFLIRLFLETVEEGRKVLVFKRNAPLQDAEVLPLLLAVRRLGPVTLLIVKPADAIRKGGDVEAIAPGLLCGYVSGFGNYADALPKNTSEWFQICANVVALTTCRPLDDASASTSEHGNAREGRNSRPTRSSPHVYLHGNCQALALLKLFREAHPNWRIGVFEVFKDDIIDQISEYHDHVRRADIIISQPVQDGYRSRDDLSLRWIRENARPDARIVTFPSMHFEGQLVGCRSLPLAAHKMDYHDVAVLALAAAGYDAADIADTLLHRRFVSADFIENEMRLSLSALQEREARDAVDVRLSPYLAQTVRDGQCFHTINHPYRGMLVWIANQLLGLIDRGGHVPPVGAECIPFPHIPCLPSVRHYFLQSGAGKARPAYQDEERFQFVDTRLEAAEYYAQYVEFIRVKPASELATLLNDTRASSFLRRFAIERLDIGALSRWRN